MTNLEAINARLDRLEEVVEMSGAMFDKDMLTVIAALRIALDALRLIPPNCTISEAQAILRNCTQSIAKKLGVKPEVSALQRLKNALPHSWTDV